MTRKAVGAAPAAGGVNAATTGYVDAAVAVDDPAPYPLSAYGLVTSSFHMDSANSVANTVSVNTIEIYRMWVPPGKTLTGAATFVTTAGAAATASGASGFALYSDDGATQLAITPTDYALFTTAGLRSAAFTTPVAAQSAGRWVRLAMIHTCVTVPKFMTGFGMTAAVLNSARTGIHRRGIFATGTTAFPASFNPATFGTNDNPALFMALY